MSNESYLLLITYLINVDRQALECSFAVANRSDKA
jgi:hypothetical protein